MKASFIQGKRCPIYLQKKTKKITLWHQQIKYISNVRIIRVLKILKSMTINNDNIIRNNNSNFFIHGLNNKNQENEKKNQKTNIVNSNIRTRFLWTI